jgi:hypothetical protein
MAIVGNQILVKKINQEYCNVGRKKCCEVEKKECKSKQKRVKKR